MKKILRYFNPIDHLGDKHYSVLFPLVVTFVAAIVSELFAYLILKDPMAVGAYAIFVFVALIIYFSFREGIRGGVIASTITTLYYLEIIYTRRYRGSMLTSGLETTAILGALYFILSGVIGWLKQTIDQLIEREADEKRRLQAIIQQLPVGVIITDRNGTVEQVN